MVASAAATATGFPPKVEACAPGGQFMISARAIMALSGNPLAMPLAVVKISGATPKCSAAHILPVRPMPHCTSSKISRMPWRSARRRSSSKENLGRNHIAALALDRLHDDGRHFLGRKNGPEQLVLDEANAAYGVIFRADAFRPAIRIGKLRVVHARNQRSKAFALDHLAAGERKRAHACARETPR